VSTYDSASVLVDLLKDLHWLPVCGRVDYKIAVLCSKTVKLKQPSKLTDCRYTTVVYVRPTVNTVFINKHSCSSVLNAASRHSSVRTADSFTTIVLGRSLLVYVRRTLCSRSAVRASDTLTRSFARYKFVTSVATRQARSKFIA